MVYLKGSEENPGSEEYVGEQKILYSSRLSCALFSVEFFAAQMAWKRFEKKRWLSPSQMQHCRASRQRLDARRTFSQRIEIAHTACFTSKDREQNDKRMEKGETGRRYKDI